YTQLLNNCWSVFVARAAIQSGFGKDSLQIGCKSLAPQCNESVEMSMVIEKLRLELVTLCKYASCAFTVFGRWQWFWCPNPKHNGRRKSRAIFSVLSNIEKTGLLRRHFARFRTSQEGAVCSAERKYAKLLSNFWKRIGAKNTSTWKTR